ncbi:MAG: hypothetical protein AAB558_02275 [Patescibacteria group bacterium]
MRGFVFSTFVISSLVAAPLLTSAAPSYTTSTFLSSIDSGEGENALDAYIDEPKGFDLAEDSSIFLVDSTNNSVEKIEADGTLTTIAGTHQYGFVNGAAGLAQFAGPEDLAVYGDGEQIFVADTGNNVIRKIEGGSVSTFLSGLSAPKGLALDGDTLFVSDTGNNRILAINRSGGSTTTFVSGLDQPTKLLFWQKARSIIFVNFGEMTVRALNVDTGEMTDPLVSDLEDIGGIFLQGRSLYVAASYDIGVFNQLWKVRLHKPDPSGEVSALNVKLLNEHRETESLNWPTDILLREDTMKWEEYYAWDQNLLFSESAAGEHKAAAKKKLQCLPIKKVGKDVWRKKWFMRINQKSETQTADFLLKPGYQGDKPFFRVKLQYDNKDFSKAHRKRSREKNQSPFTKGPVIASVGGTTEGTFTTAPKGLKLMVRKPKKVTLGWTAVEGANKYKVQLWHKDKRIVSKRNVQKRKIKIKSMYVTSNQNYKFRVKTCANGACSDWSSFKTFRTPPAAPKKVLRILPNRGERITQTAKGKFKATLTFKLHKKNKHLRAKVQLCSKNVNHPDEITVNRVYVLYKGGSAILAFRKNGSRPQHYAGKHRFQDEYGAQVDALLGRPKAIAFSSDGTKMYIAENNKLAVYDMYQKTLTELAGHLMDSYTEGMGSEARFSDITSIAISPDDDWLYVVDRNNHRIRKVDTATGQTVYITGAGGTNFSFGSEESNGYQEGGPCPGETERGVAGCAYFNRPTGIVVSPDGKTLYVAEGSNNRVRKVDVATGVTSLVAGGGTAGFTNGTGSAAAFNGPYSLDVTSDGKTLYVADKSNHAIRKIDLNTNAVTTVVGKGVIGKKDGAFSGAYLAIPEYVQEENGVLYWTEAGTHTVRAGFLSSQQVVTLSGNASRGYTDGAGVDAEWNNPKGFAFRAGKIYVADSTNDVIRTIQL